MSSLSQPLLFPLYKPKKVSLLSIEKKSCLQQIKEPGAKIIEQVRFQNLALSRKAAAVNISITSQLLRRVTSKNVTVDSTIK